MHVEEICYQTSPCAQYTVGANISKKSEFGAEEGLLQGHASGPTHVLKT